MKKIMCSATLIVAILGFTGCGDDDGDSCTTCSGYSVSGVAVPAVEVCEGDNGNAFVSGIDTTVSYSQYIATLEAVTTCD